MKISYYVASEEGKVPLAFKMCGIFQACCDCCLGIQWAAYGNGKGEEERALDGGGQKGRFI